MKYAGTGALILLLSLAIEFRYAPALTNISWSYSDQDAWETVSSWDCNGTRQSPIDIDTGDLVTNDSLISLSLTNFDQSFSGNFSNTGHSVTFAPDSGLNTAVIENHLGTYELLQFHFHWGSSSSVGSEHTIDGTMYAGELHFVSRKTTGDSTDGDALTVIGVLLESDSSMSLSGSWLELYDNIPTNYPNSNSVSGLDLTEFLPSSLSYYYYEGSLTVPGCSEVVQWFVLRNPVSVPSEFLDALRTTVNDVDGDTLTENYRDTQDLNGRDVYVVSSATGRASFRLSGTLLVLTVFLVTLLH